jgi:shikimate dehydrogenase
MTKTSNPIKAGVIGWPIGHSRSPLIHTHWLRQYGIAGSYEKIVARPEEFAQTLRDLAGKGFAGVNVTLPHKRAALVLAETCDEAARHIGAANTLTFNKDGSIHASNTDAFGFIQNLKTIHQDWSGANALVLGAGGAARAVLYGLGQEGAHSITVSNRTFARAQDLCTEFSSRACSVTPLEWQDADAALESVDLLVNTTSLGMQGEPKLEMSLEKLSAHALVTDLVYAPLQTALLGEAARRGNPTLDGLGMLLHQARPGFESWFGTAPEVTPELRSIIVQDLERSA